ncbi:Uncharacterised protein [Amycolatopsis camponoti]|uniref:Uncharacterized protein n=1 Tax=Amycolatopsis camponoti TaxID=2606593 RepID=A0A6I8M253_9PSEU|nr:Uncharacterised protein [Amycolatopsis camponoti]
MRHQLGATAHRRRLGPVPARRRLRRAAGRRGHGPARALAWALTLAVRILRCATARIGTLAGPGAGSIVGHGSVLQLSVGLTAPLGRDARDASGLPKRSS